MSEISAKSDHFEVSELPQKFLTKQTLDTEAHIFSNSPINLVKTLWHVMNVEEIRSNNGIIIIY